MVDTWLFQIRITASPELAGTVRDDPQRMPPQLDEVLRRHGATLVCQFDAFAGYVAEAEKSGADKYPLYQWTRDTIENPEKKARYLRSFTAYVNGEDVYARDIADTLQSELSALAGTVGIERVVKFDTNPANNPQPPATVEPHSPRPRASIDKQ
ncbi:hypothetical protein AWB64_01750 [Caballeronia sordidicola]|uniref:Uncharacterized protein n=1 Tax=Caballeronia sordidicola TaxID=196367 RepID=A0A158FSI9_CABSO|nr:hypothetical protein [Caballeronia sordidicola]SAL22784.1 hypothetical protein AWB64_01750 [Caballeronia sordidicola]